MNANVGSIDRAIRIVIGVALLGWAGVTGNKLGYLGVIPLATALAGWCPLYVPLKLSTRKR
jgi:hypothetical protein